MPVKDPAKNDVFNYNEKVFAGYISFDKSWEKWSLSTGIRAEQTNIEARSQSVNENNNQNYLEWFPTLNLGYRTSEKLNIYANYKRSLQRPNYSNINPFRYYLNDNAYVTGNPELKPIFTNQYKLGLSINNIFVIETYYKKYKNNIFQIPIQNNNSNTIAYSSVNINYTEEIGFDIEAYVDVNDKWSMYVGSSFYNYKDNATLFNEVISKSTWSNYTIFSNDFSFLKDNSLVANLALTYMHKNVQGLQVVDSRLASDISIRKTLFKGKGSLSLLISDLFNQQDFYWTTKFADQDNTTKVNLDNRYIRLGFRYKFGNTKLSTNERTSSVQERERLEHEH